MRSGWTLDRLTYGEKIAGVSAILLFVFMFFDWFGVKLSNNSNLLFAIQGDGPGKSAWEALDYIPIVLLIAITVTLYEIGLRVVLKHRAPTNAVVAILGVISAVLILYRTFDPPTLGVEGTITYEGTVQLPIFLALVAACGIAYGGYRAMREEKPLRPRGAAFSRASSSIPHGERIAGASAILLFAFMFLNWYGMESSEDSFGLFSVSRTAWEALDYIPMVLLIAITVTLYETGLRVVLKHRAPTDAVVAILGVISAVLILYRIVYPPNFGYLQTAFDTITYEGTVQPPIFLALAAAVGIAYGGLGAMREEGRQLSAAGQIRR